MPVTKQALKKLRKDKKRTISNKNVEQTLRKAMKSLNKDKSQKKIVEAIKLIDKAAKRNIIHANKAARLKSRLSKSIAKPSTKSKKSSK